MAEKCEWCGKTTNTPGEDKWLSEGIVFKKWFCSRKCKAEYERNK